MAEVIKFAGNPKPAVPHGEVPWVVILPVVRIERIENDPPAENPRRRRRRPR